MLTIDTHSQFDLPSASASVAAQYYAWTSSYYPGVYTKFSDRLSEVAFIWLL